MATLDLIIGDLEEKIKYIIEKNKNNNDKLTEINRLAQKLEAAITKLISIKNPDNNQLLEAERQTYIKRLTEIMNNLIDNDANFKDIDRQINEITNKITTFTKSINQQLPFEEYIKDFQEITTRIDSAFNEFKERSNLENQKKLLNSLNESKDKFEELSSATDPKDPQNIPFQTVIQKLTNGDQTDQTSNLVKTTIEELLVKLRTINADPIRQNPNFFDESKFKLNDYITKLNINNLFPEPAAVVGGRYPRKRRVKKTHRKPRKGGFTYKPKSQSKSKKSTKSRRSSSSKTRK
jgi:hypothetical protein